MSLRAYELAKQLGMPTKTLIERCGEIGIELQNNFANIATGEAETIFKFITTGERPAPVQAEPPAEARAAAVAAPPAEAAPVPAPAQAPAAAEGGAAPVAAAVEAPADPGKARKRLGRKKEKTSSELAAAAAAALEQAIVGGRAAGGAPAATAEPEPAPAVEAAAAAPDAAEEAAVGQDGDKGKDEGQSRFGVVRPAPDYISDADFGPRGRAVMTEEQRRARRRPAGRSGGGPDRRPARWPRRNVKTGDPAKVVRPTSAEVTLPVTVRALSQAISIRTGDIVRRLMQQGVMATINDALEPETAQVIAMELGCELKIRQQAREREEELVGAGEEADAPESLRPRAPVVTVMGHVDHGKTSILDGILKMDVARGEAGGITQHLGAYRVEKDGKAVVFLDTPGHAAFTEMRARGANVTDIVALVVAADDGVMPQTQEAINHARAAGVAIVVAINKVDLPGANVQKVKQQLASLDLIPEEWGGKVGMVECSAVSGQGLDTLVERLALEAELLDLKANPDRPGRGAVLEARLSQGRGIVATVLVRSGTLHRGDVVLCSHGYGRAKSLVDRSGRDMEEAGPSTPVEVVGLSEMPMAGDTFCVVDDLGEARKVAERRGAEHRAAALQPRARVTLDNLSASIQAGQVRELRLVVKADVQGSLEVLRKTLGDISGKDVRTTVIHAATGGINESDVLLAEASGGIIIGFNVSTDGPARALAVDKGVDVRIYRIIYEVVDEVTKALEGMLAPEKKEVIQGHLDIRAVFSISRSGNIAGCMVSDGSIVRSSRVRLLRNGKILYDGGLGGLRRGKDDVREVQKGFECGVKLANYEDVKVGDVLQAYEVQEVAGKL